MSYQFIKCFGLLKFVSISSNITQHFFLNQVRAGHSPAHAWFLEIAFVQELSMCVCVCARACVHVCGHACVWMDVCVRPRRHE